MAFSNKVKTKIFYTSVIILILIIFGSVRFLRNSIINEHEISSCYTDEIRRVGREQYILVKYHFNIDGKVYKSEVSFSQVEMSYENAKLLENKSFPVAYNKKYGYVSSYILIFPKDYKEFNVPYPDSLKWVLPLIKNY